MECVPRVQVVVLMLALVCACDMREMILEGEAADCPDRPPWQISGLPPRFVGFNAYYLQEETARAVRRGLPEAPALEETYRKARALGARVVRTWAFNDDPAKAGDSAIQTASLVYDETALRGLDLVLARADAYELKLVLSLGNYWNAYGGARQYVAWAGLPDPVEGDPRFFTDRRVIDRYKAHLAQLLDRVNTVDGWRYGDHPAVLIWEVLNEPRNMGLDADGAALRAWTDEIAVHVRSLAPRHFVGTSEEGFDTRSEGYDGRFWEKTSGGLALGAGAFRPVVESPAIDVTSIHLYPESWGWDSRRIASAGAHWIYEHAELARAAGKPLLLGEFALRNDGEFTLKERRAMYRGWLRCAKRVGVAGATPWMFAYDARPEWDAYTFYFRDGTRPEDPVNRYADLLLEAARE